MSQNNQQSEQQATQTFYGTMHYVHRNHTTVWSLDITAIADLARTIPTVDSWWGYTNVDPRTRRYNFSYVGQYFFLVDLPRKLLFAVLRRPNYIFGYVKVIDNNNFYFASSPSTIFTIMATKQLSKSITAWWVLNCLTSFFISGAVILLSVIESVPVAADHAMHDKCKYIVLLFLKMLKPVLLLLPALINIHLPNFGTVLFPFLPLQETFDTCF